MMKGCFLLLGWMFILEATFAVPASADDSAPQSNDGQGNCKPFKAYFVWDHSKANFAVERKYINELINSTASGTDIILNMLDGNKTHFIKTDSKSVYDETSETMLIKDVNKISYSDLQKDISEHSQGNTEQAFVLFFFVNKNTHLDQKKTELKDFLKKIKVFVVSIFEPVPDFWKSLATDKDHVLQVENYSKTNDFLALICQDSKLVCDNHMYWTRTKCLPCADISCKSLCPYFGECTEQIPLARTVSVTQTVAVTLLIFIFLEVVGYIVYCKCSGKQVPLPRHCFDRADVQKGKRDDGQSQAKEPEHAVKVQFDNIRRRKKNDSAK